MALLHFLSFSKRYFVVLFFWPMMVMAETGAVIDWEADNCPSALPAAQNPYMERIINNSEADVANIFEGKDEKYTNDAELFDLLSDKSNRYSQCSFAVRLRLDIPINAYDSYNIYVNKGNVRDAERLYSMDAILSELADTEDPNGPIYSIVSELYERAYTQGISDMAKSRPEETKDMLIREFFCDCLETPVEEFE